MIRFISAALLSWDPCVVDLAYVSTMSNPYQEFNAMHERTRQDVINDLRAPLQLPPVNADITPEEQAMITSVVTRIDAMAEALAIILAETRS